MTPVVFPADSAGDLPDGEHHHAAGKVHHGQGVPAEGGADEAGVPDPAPQRGAVQGHPSVQVSGGGWDWGAVAGRSHELLSNLSLKKVLFTNQDIWFHNSAWHWAEPGDLGVPSRGRPTPVHCSLLTCLNHGGFVALLCSGDRPPPGFPLKAKGWGTLPGQMWPLTCGRCTISLCGLREGGAQPTPHSFSASIFVRCSPANHWNSIIPPVPVS